MYARMHDSTPRMMAVQMATRPIPRRFRVKAYPVNVEPGTAVVKGPYSAETIKVAVESDYVVVGL
jgi:hypothetical protein